MTYSDFSIDSVQRAFGLVLHEHNDLFADVPTVPIRPGLRAFLDEMVPLALDINTEKARSEMIIAPILFEVRRLAPRRIGFFSGIRFDVAPERGLAGYCDFILSRSPAQLVIRAPILTVVEAKNENIKAGFGQCIAEMVAARMFNEREGEGPTTIFGAVTTGSAWRFLKLERDSVFADQPEYNLSQIEKILGILLHCVGGGSS
jgi:hypothetical protein